MVPAKGGSQMDNKNNSKITPFENCPALDGYPAVNSSNDIKCFYYVTDYKNIFRYFS